jgi:hypothetical protein
MPGVGTNATTDNHRIETRPRLALSPLLPAVARSGVSVGVVEGIAGGDVRLLVGRTVPVVVVLVTTTKRGVERGGGGLDLAERDIRPLLGATALLMTSF